MNVSWENNDEITGEEIVFIAEEYRVTDSVHKEKLRTMVIFICPWVWPQATAISIEREKENERKEERRCLACQPSSPPLYLQPQRCTNFCRRRRWSRMCLWCVCVCACVKYRRKRQDECSGCVRLLPRPSRQRRRRQNRAGPKGRVSARRWMNVGYNPPVGLL